MFERLMLKVHDLLPGEEGQGATDYALVIGFLLVGGTVGLGALGAGIENFFARVASELGTLFP